jgi:putative tryptophan/tyrosine transport system substrate-binding protein
MKKLIFTITFCLCMVSTAMAYDIVVVKSRSDGPYEEMGRLVSAALLNELPAVGQKSIQPHSIVSVTVGKQKLSDFEEKIVINSPDLIIAIGSKALQATENIARIPIVHLLVPSPEKYMKSRANVTGVRFSLSAQAQFNELSRHIPGVKRLGVIYDPKRTGRLIDQALFTLTDHELVALPTNNPREVPALLQQLRGRVDALWLIPDLTVVNPITLESYIRFSMENKIPVLAFAEKYLEKGAAMAVTIDTGAMAEKAAQLASRIVRGADPQEIGPVVVAGRVRAMINHKVFAKLNIILTRRDD